MSIPSLPSSFGPSAWGGLDALSPVLPSAAPSVGEAGRHEGLFARHDEASPLGISAASTGGTPAEFRDRLIACLCGPD